MSIALHSGPETGEADSLRPPHPELVHLCREIQGGPRAELTLRPLIAIAEAWRALGTFEEKMMAAIAAANAQGPEVWHSIVSAVCEQQDYEDLCYKCHFTRLREEIAATDSEAIREARTRSMNRQHKEYWDERFAPYRSEKTQPEE